MLWPLLGLMALVSVALALWPLLRSRTSGASRADYDLSVYRDQLAELDRDLERGVLTPDQTEGARLEIQRRILAVSEDKAAAAPGFGGRSKITLALAALVAVVMPLAAFGLYSVLGSPGLPDQSFHERMVSHLSLPRDQAEKMIASVEHLAEQLRATPDDAEGWETLARSYVALGRPDDAVDAYRAALAHGLSDSDTFSSLGEAIAMRDSGDVGPEARQAFLQALAHDPHDPRARYYIALGRAQLGDAKGAIALWKAIALEAPADAPWLSSVRQRIAELAQDAHLDPATVAPEQEQSGAALIATPAPSLAAPPASDAPASDDQADEASQGGDALSAMPEAQRKMVLGMVEGLARKLDANPDDFDGWMRLGKAYGVMKRTGESQAAYGKAMALRPNDISAKLAYGEGLMASQGAGQGQPAQLVPAQLVTVMQSVLALDANQPEALYVLGLAAAQAGQKDEAKAHWTHLLSLLPADEPMRKDVEGRIKALN